MTKNKIIISSASSRLLDNLKLSSHNHFDSIDWYTINTEEIFKAYDLIQPHKICICKKDLSNIAIKAFIEEKIVQDNCILIDDCSYLNVVNLNLFKSYKIPRNNKYAILLDNIEKLPEHILQKLESDQCNIHMFNNPSIVNNYNLGTLLEYQKAFIFASYEGIIGKNFLYKNEAILCGAKYIDIESMNMFDNSEIDTLLDIDDFIKREFYATA
jgi:hypothetical protein